VFVFRAAHDYIIEVQAKRRTQLNNGLFSIFAIFRSNLQHSCFANVLPDLVSSARSKATDIDP
jgi:hypothetical protein